MKLSKTAQSFRLTLDYNSHIHYKWKQIFRKIKPHDMAYNIAYSQNQQIHTLRPGYLYVSDSDACTVAGLLVSNSNFKGQNSLSL